MSYKEVLHIPLSEALHAASAVVRTTTAESFVLCYGWCAGLSCMLLARVGNAWISASRCAGAEVFRSHRALMLCMLALSVTAWGAVVAFKLKPLAVHAQLCPLIHFLTVLQSSWGAIQLLASTREDDGRRIWHLFHRFIAVLELVSAAIFMQGYLVSDQFAGRSCCGGLTS